MFKTVAPELWVVDAEWVPDADTGRRLHGLPADTPEVEVMERMWSGQGATDEEPRPYLKTALCRVVSIAFLRRRSERGSVLLDLHSLPPAAGPQMSESALLTRFLDAAKHRPQLVGFNLRGADLPILIQRAAAHAIAAPGFCGRPDKPWEGHDYFNRASEGCVDLMEIFGSRGNTPSLNQLAAAAAVPGKFEAGGKQVVDLWLAGECRRIVEYNEYDVLTTYLLWLRAAHLGGFVSAEGMEAEERQLDNLLRERIGKGATHLEIYRERWAALRRGARDGAAGSRAGAG
jgi:predicted PolB exonuclease-like 3'-5' exonuclease